MWYDYFTCTCHQRVNTQTIGQETEQNNNNKTLTLNLFSPNFHTTNQHIRSSATPSPCPCLHTMSCPVAVDNVCRQHNLQQPTVNEKGERLEVFFSLFPPKSNDIWQNSYYTINDARQHLFRNFRFFSCLLSVNISTAEDILNVKFPSLLFLDPN
jgi:hypothetical protein